MKWKNKKILTVSQIFLIFHDLHNFKAYWLVFCRLFPSLSLSDFSHHDENGVLKLGEEYNRQEIVFFSSHYIKGYMISIWFTTGDVKVKHLVKVMISKLFHCTFLFFSFSALIFGNELLNVSHTQEGCWWKWYLHILLLSLQGRFVSYLLD